MAWSLTYGGLGFQKQSLRMGERRASRGALGRPRERRRLRRLDVPQIQGYQMRHCDVRYALFFAKTDGKSVMLTHFYLTTGEQFFSRFSQCQGKVLNKKLQIPLPVDFFTD